MPVASRVARRTALPLLAVTSCRVMKSKIVVFLFFVFVVLHHDVWNWDNRSLWFGFLPAGLGYHVTYSIAVAVFWYLVSRFAWPHATEAWAEKGPGE